MLVIGASSLGLRHDLKEAQYIEFGEQFPAVCQVAGLGSGTLIAPQWVLTAAHVPEMVLRMEPDAPLTVKLDGKEYKVAHVVYPDERAGLPSRPVRTVRTVKTPRLPLLSTHPKRRRPWQQIRKAQTLRRWPAKEVMQQP